MPESEKGPGDTDPNELPSESDDTDSQGNSCTFDFIERCGGYNLVIAFCCFMCYFIFCGIAFTSGIYFVFFKEEFGTGSGVTSWISSVQFGMIFLTGK